MSNNDFNTNVIGGSPSSVNISGIS
jgi:hypothetical protein